MELKLSELIAAMEGASNRLIDVENLSEQEIEALHRHYETLVKMAREHGPLTASHSVEEAVGRHEVKVKARRRR
jgi:low affinity Fe/Cu permease